MYIICLYILACRGDSDLHVMTYGVDLVDIIE